MSGGTVKGGPPSSTPSASIAGMQSDVRKGTVPSSMPSTKVNATSLYSSSSTYKPISAPMNSGSVLSTIPSSSKGSPAVSRPIGTINKNDLINSNPEAVASSSNSHQNPRLSTASDNGQDSTDGKGEDGKKGRRRKANRACSHCQKAHLTCDDSRPCERCVKKGLSDSCTDGARKKAKYLLDEDEILELKRQKERKECVNRAEHTLQGIKDESDETSNRLATPSDWPTPSSNAAQLSPAQLVSFNNATTIAPSSLNDSTQQQQQQPLSAVKPDMLSNGDASDVYGQLATFSPTSSTGLQHAFGSETTSLEYSILSSMLNGIDPAWLSGTSDGSQPAEHDLGRVLKQDATTAGPFSHMGIDGMPWELNNDDTSAWRDASRGEDKQNRVEPLHHMESTVSANNTSTDGLAAYDALEVPSPQGTAATMEVGPRNGHVSLQGDDAETAGAKLAQTTQYGRRAAAAVAAATGQDKKPDAAWNERVKHIYSDQTKPFPYTEGYHFLIKYVTANLEKAQVLRIVRALAIFRPSLIALQMPLTEEDEIFVERSIQRTIMEFEKLISFSGTPTVVWRRTCEVVVVGSEFSMLTQWSKDYLRGRYIYEFFDKPSILEYWEKFALHAFENTAQSIMMQVALKTSTGNTVKCAACFSIKRDVFDLPSLIVGNFLPILS